MRQSRQIAFSHFCSIQLLRPSSTFASWPGPASSLPSLGATRSIHVCASKDGGEPNRKKGVKKKKKTDLGPGNMAKRDGACSVFQDKAPAYWRFRIGATSGPSRHSAAEQKNKKKGIALGRKGMRCTTCRSGLPQKCRAVLVTPRAAGHSHHGCSCREGLPTGATGRVRATRGQCRRVNRHHSLSI